MIAYRHECSTKMPGWQQGRPERIRCLEVDPPSRREMIPIEGRLGFSDSSMKGLFNMTGLIDRPRPSCKERSECPMLRGNIGAVAPCIGVMSCCDWLRTRLHSFRLPSSIRRRQPTACCNRTTPSCYGICYITKCSFILLHISSVLISCQTH